MPWLIAAIFGLLLLLINLFLFFLKLQYLVMPYITIISYDELIDPYYRRRINLHKEDTPGNMFKRSHETLTIIEQKSSELWVDFVWYCKLSLLGNDTYSRSFSQETASIQKNRKISSISFCGYRIRNVSILHKTFYAEEKYSAVV